MKKIRLHPDLKKELAKEFEVSYQTISMSLRYVFESELSERIRERAKQMLLDEAKKVNEAVANN
ncbi:MAG: hypothetical protein RLZZ546_2151 [Bacteroidota bacterium]|jgi:RNase P/RNase MRP subunit p30